jgi:putative ABC transport system ATP-binding protein
VSATSSEQHATALELVGIRKRFVTTAGDQVIALDQVGLSISRGCMVSVIGSNGAGKSTLLAVIGGGMLPDAGLVRIGGADRTRMPSWKRAGLVAHVRQNPEHNVFGGLTVEQNFALRVAGNRRSFGLSRALSKGVRAAAIEALRPFGMGLEDRLHQSASTLSGGQRQAVAMAMAMIGDPEILLLDEHVAALDPKSARVMTRETERLIRERNLATLMVTHDMGHALNDSDRLLMMHRGAVVLDLNREEMKRMDAGELVRRFEMLAGEAMPDRAVLTQGASASGATTTGASR